MYTIIKLHDFLCKFSDLNIKCTLAISTPSLTLMFYNFGVIKFECVKYACAQLMWTSVNSLYRLEGTIISMFRVLLGHIMLQWIAN
jgi:hypothetical protein